MKRGGYTFIEMLVVVVIIAMIAAIASPRLAASLHSHNVARYFNSVERLCVDARRMAAESGRSVQLVADQEGTLSLQQTDVETGDPVAVSSVAGIAEVELASYHSSTGEVGQDEWEVLFYPDGTADLGGLGFSLGFADDRTLVVTPTTGRGRVLPGTFDENAPQTQKWEAGDRVQRG